MSGASGALEPPTSLSPEVRLCLLSGFALARAGQPIPLPQSGERLLAFLALHERPVHRSHVAGSLWLDGSEARSAGSLRSALWRVHQVDRNLIMSNGAHLGLASDIAVDVRTGTLLACRLIASSRTVDDDPAGIDSVRRLDSDLLPNWYADNWLVPYQEQWRQLRLHALEALALMLSRGGCHASAVEAAMAAVRGEPLRESAHRCLIRVHLAEENHSEALRAFDRCRQLLFDELGVEPSRSLMALVGTALVGSRRAG